MLLSTSCDQLLSVVGCLFGILGVAFTASATRVPSPKTLLSALAYPRRPVMPISQPMSTAEWQGHYADVVREWHGDKSRDLVLGFERSIR